MLVKRLAFYLLLLLVLIYLILISTWINLNSNTLTPWFEFQINSRLPNRYSAKIGLVKTEMTGLNIESFRLYDLADDSVSLDIQSIHLSAGLIGLLFFQELDYSMKLYDGTVNGSLDFFPNRLIKFVLNNLQINQNVIVRTSNLIVSNPIVNGEGFYQFNDIPEGKLAIAIEDLTISGKSEITKIPFELPNTHFSKLTSEVMIQGNQAKLKMNSNGDFVANLEGSIAVNRSQPIRSEFDINMVGEFTAGFESKLGFFKSILVSYKNAAGKLSVNLSGNLQRPKVKKN